MKEKNYNKYKEISKFIFNVISWVILILMVMIAGFLLYYLVATKISEKRGVKNNALFSLYTIISNSMEPNLNIYDIIVDVKAKSPEEIKLGDIITFNSRSSLTKDKIITHRVVEIIYTDEGIEYATKGDHNGTKDGATVNFDNVLGIVKMRIPYVGKIQSIMSTKLGWLLIVIVPALIIISFDIFKLIILFNARKKVTTVLTKEEEVKQEEETIKEEIADKLKERYAINSENFNEIKNEEKVESETVEHNPAKIESEESTVEERELSSNIKETSSLPKRKINMELPKKK